MPPHCSICTSDHHHEINDQLIRLIPMRAIAGRFNISKSAVHRHRRKCIPQLMSRAVELRGREHAAQVRDAEEEEIVIGETIRRKVETLVVEAMNVYGAARTDGDNRAAILALNSARASAELVAKITGTLTPPEPERDNRLIIRLPDGTDIGTQLRVPGPEEHYLE